LLPWGRIRYAAEARIRYAAEARIRYAAEARIRYAAEARIRYAAEARIRYAAEARIRYTAEASEGWKVFRCWGRRLQVYLCDIDSIVPIPNFIVDELECWAPRHAELAGQAQRQVRFCATLCKATWIGIIRYEDPTQDVACVGDDELCIDRRAVGTQELPGVRAQYGQPLVERNHWRCIARADSGTTTTHLRAGRMNLGHRHGSSRFHSRSGRRRLN
jgi:hypothetical protein